MTDLKCLKPVEAWEMIQSEPKAFLIDIRSSMEFLFVGHPVGAVHIPWIDEPEWTVNPNFVKDIRKLLLGGIEEGFNSAPIILICRSGKRSKFAGAELIKSNILNVYHVTEGFEGDLNESHQRSSSGGWRFWELPWEQC
jgi:rhodanese-related sulfurtransferase